MSGNELRGVNDFLRQYDNAGGRERLAQMGFNEQQIRGFVERARHLAEGGRFPI